MNWIELILMAILSSIGALGGAALIALLPSKLRQKLMPIFLSYAAGAMLAAALLGMIPRAISNLPNSQGGLFVLLGLLFFYLLERLSLWHHCHDVGCKLKRSSGKLLLIGDSFHNFVDGVVIAAAYLQSPQLGWAAAIAVIAHEIPQEIGDYAVLIESGFDKWQSLRLNFYSALSTLPGAIFGYWFLPNVQSLIPYFLAFSGASFLYIALGDLLPKLQTEKYRLYISLLSLFAGIATIAMFHV